MVQRLLLQQGVPNLCGLASKVEVSTRLAGDRHARAEGVIVEGVALLFQLVSKAIVGLIEVERVIRVCAAAQSCEWIVLLENTARTLLVARQGGLEAKERHGWRLCQAVVV